MKKAELEEIIQSLRNQLASSRRDADLYKERYHALLEKQNEIKEDALYENFKDQYGVFLNRFMKEWMNEHVSIDIDGSDCPNYVDVMLNIDNETISRNTGSISVSGIVRECY